MPRRSRADLLFSGGDDGLVLGWDITKLECVVTLGGHRDVRRPSARTPPIRLPLPPRALASPVACGMAVKPGRPLSRGGGRR